MTLHRSDDLTAADWITQSSTPWDRLVTFGPSGFPGYARLRYISDPIAADQHESEFDLPQEHLSDIAQARRTLNVLAAFTSTPDVCFYCVWEGHSNISLPPGISTDRMVVVPNRRFALLGGTVGDVQEWESTLGDGSPIAPPALVWPSDHSWVFASDVDPHWAGIGASEAAIEALLAQPDLDIVPADPLVRPLSYR